MGDPKKRRKKFSAPFQRWEKERIDNEKALIKEYGLKNKKEIWKANAKLRSFTKRAKKLVNIRSPQDEKEKEQLLTKLKSLSLISADAKLEDILDLTVKDILERRLQTIIYKQGLARSVKAARQFIVHRHIKVNNIKVSIPSYLVKAKEQSSITFSPSSSLFDQEHPERTLKKKVQITKKKPESKPEEKTEK